MKKYLALLLPFFTIFMYACSGGEISGGLSRQPPHPSAKNILTSDLQLTSITGNQQNAHVIYLSDKNLWFSVYEDWNSGNSVVKGRFIKADGSYSGSEVTITTGKGTNNQTNPRAAYKPGDKIVITWLDPSATTFISYNSITSTSINPNLNPTDATGVSLGTEATIANEANQTATARRSPKVIYDSFNDRFVFAWAESRATGPSITYTPSFNPTRTGSYSQTVTLAGITEFVVYNTKNAGLVDTVASTSVLPYTQTPAATTYTRTYTAYSSIQAVDLSADTTQNSVLIVWEGQPFTQTVTTSWVDAPASPQTLTPTATPGNCAGPGQTNCTSSSISWTFNPAIFDLYFRSTVAPPNVSVTDTKIPNVASPYSHTGLTNAENYQYLIQATKNGVIDNNGLGNGELSTSVGSATSPSTKNIYGVFAGNIASGVTPITICNQNSRLPSVDFLSYTDTSVIPNASNKRFLVVWEDLRATNEKVYGQLITSGGGLFSSNFNITANPAGVDMTLSKQTTPTVVTDAKNSRFTVIWSDTRNGAGNADIYGTFVYYDQAPPAPYTYAAVTQKDGAGNPVHFAVSTVAGDQSVPSFAYNLTTKQYLTLWNDSRNGLTNLDLYGQVLDVNLNIDTTTISDMKSGVPVSVTLQVSNGVPPYTWNVVSGALPTGSGPATNAAAGTASSTLALDKNGGNISGTPILAGNYQVTVQVTDANRATATQLYSITVREPLQISTASLKGWTEGVDGYLDTLTATGGSPSYTWSIDSSKLPAGLIYNTTTGVISGKPTKAGTYPFTVTLRDSAPIPQTASADLSITINAAATSPTPLKDTSSIQSFKNGVLINQSLLTTDLGGTAPYTWSLITGSLPTGTLPTGNYVCAAGTGPGVGTICLDPSGAIVGIPSVAASYSFKLQVKDSLGGIATPTYTFTVIDPLLIDSTPPKSGNTNNIYNFAIQATGGTTPYTWSSNDFKIPGLTFKDGVIAGTPTTAGTYNFTASITDSASKQQSDSKSFSLTITDPFVISTSTLPNVQINQTYNQTLAVKGGRLPYSYSVTKGVLPAGLGLDANTGIITGTAATLGTYSFIITATDADSRTTTQTYSITVSASTGGTATDNTAPSILTATLNNAATGISYQQMISAKGGRIPYKFTISSGALPAGLSLNADTGIISGVPTNIGTYSFIVTVTDVDNKTGTQTYTVNVGGGSVVITISSGSGNITSSSSLSRTQLVGIPDSFLIRNGISFTVSNVTPADTVTGILDFGSTLPTNPVFYKIVNGVWTKLISGTDYSLNGTRLTLVVKDKVSASDSSATIDSDSTPGVINGLIVVGQDNQVSSGGASTVANTSPPASAGGGGGGCFIATAAYGSYLDPHVMVLRHFRDDVLLQSAAGKAFVKFYYTYSPPIADFIAEHDTLRMLVRFALTPLIVAVKYPLLVGCALVIGAAYLIARRMRVRLMEPEQNS